MTEQPTVPSPAPLATPRRPVVLVILDGFGISPSKQNNAVAQAQTPNLDDWFARYPSTTLSASGLAVGLPDGQMGNSEVGHLTLGCGHVVRQDMVRISDAIDNGEFFSNPVLIDALQRAAASQRPLHLLGLVSDGGVHSHLRHLKAMIRLCGQQGVRPLLHMITDGRDTAPKSALGYLQQIEPLLQDNGGAVASVMGRFYGMDRDNRWDRTQQAWRALTQGEGNSACAAESAIKHAYLAGDSDEFIHPTLLPAFEPIQGGDQVVFFNYRKDRPRQMVAALASRDFDAFDRGTTPPAEVTCFMQYDARFDLPFAFDHEHPEVTLSQAISEAGLRQFHCAETEKYAHVTYFFNGGQTIPCKGETQKLVPSPDVTTYDQAPEMSAAAVADTVIEAIDAQQHEFIVVNFANGDMVGHTAQREAVIQAVEALDREAGRVIAAAVAAGYSLVITADHGNCEEMVDPLTQAPHTQHTTYPVPCLVIDEQRWALSCAGSIANVAPTVLQLMGLPQPHKMTAGSLLLKAFGNTHSDAALQGAA